MWSAVNSAAWLLSGLIAAFLLRDLIRIEKGGGERKDSDEN